METGFYIHRGSKTHFSGVQKKIDDHIEYFRKYFDMHEVIIEKESTNILKSISWRLPGGSWGADYGGALREIKEMAAGKVISFVFVRGQAIDKRYVGFLRSLRNAFPNTTIILEVPTYPYDMELIQDIEMFPWYFKNKVWSKKIQKYVNRVITYDGYDEIYNIKTIEILNGIKLNGLELADLHIAEDDTIDLLAVAQFQKSHGYERIIRGLAKYYQNGGHEKIVLHMVGNGPEKKNYEKIVKEEKLDKNVIFYGSKTGSELQKMYNLADIALGVFGLYKRKISISSALKIREYLANGIPIVSGAYEDVFKGQSCEFFLRFPNDSSDVDIERIVDFYNNLYHEKTKLSIRQRVYDYAKSSIDISKTMQPVLDFINTNQSRNRGQVI